VFRYFNIAITVRRHIQINADSGVEAENLASTEAYLSTKSWCFSDFLAKYVQMETTSLPKRDNTACCLLSSLKACFHAILTVTDDFIK